MGKMATLIVTAAVTSSMATSAYSNSMTGFYLGVNGGYGVGTTPIRSPIGDKVDLGMKGAIGGLHLGFQRDCNQYIAGVEGYASLSETKGTASAQIAKNTFKRKDAFGIAARLGTKLNCWFTYIKLGYENAKFANHGTFSAFGVNLTANKNKRLNGIVPGVGFETIICHHWLLGGEWTYAFYQGKKFTSTIGNIAVKDKRKPRIGDFKLRFGYLF